MEKRNYLRSGKYSKATLDKSGAAIVESTRKPLVLPKGKDIYALNLNEELQNTIIHNAKQVIEKVNLAIEEFMPQYQSGKEFFESAQQDWENTKVKMLAFKEEVSRQESIINVFTKYKSVDAAEKRLQRVADVQVHTNGFESAKRVDWIVEVEKVLISNDLFMSFAEIWEELGKNQEIVDRSNRTKTGFKYMKTPVFNSVYEHATRPNIKRGVQRFTMYQEKFGLVEWLNQDRSLANPKHLKAFMG